MTVRPDMQPLADQLGAREPAPHAVPIKHSIFNAFLIIARKKNDGAPVSVLINDALRQWLGDR